jgi:hypothetical protein
MTIALHYIWLTSQYRIVSVPSHNLTIPFPLHYYRDTSSMLSQTHLSTISLPSHHYRMFKYLVDILLPSHFHLVTITIMSCDMYQVTWFMSRANITRSWRLPGFCTIPRAKTSKLSQLIFLPHQFTISLPYLRYLINIPLPYIWLSPKYHIVTVPSQCNLISIPFPSYYHLNTISLPSHYNLNTISNPSHCHLISIAISNQSQGYPNCIWVPHYPLNTISTQSHYYPTPIWLPPHRHLYNTIPSHRI